ncbi:ATP-binding protein, partial [Caballeronia arationis]|uniref:ATP-binding protein n=1 Tax=Caballeronia arationis TaxID=1777142 RepID=UPI000AA6A8DF
FRQGAGRIAEIAARTRLIAARRGARPSWPDVAQAMAGSAGTLDAHARRSAATVTDDALVAPPSLRRALADLAARARMRATLADGLGPALTARYRPGVRALMTGPPGTGKTLAAHWLATRLGLPLYRADSAALTSKYYGETEKNLSGLFAAAEHADVVLFFDEADALFAARTEIGDANDRFANAQTNYLLQRIEEYDGIVLLASNSRDRFDPAFVRRLDAILDFPMPEALARRDLWIAHLGSGHGLAPHEFDRLAVAIDLSGGHIRNIVLAAAARARAERRPIGWSDVMHGVAHEYGKLGRMPPELRP